MRRFLIVLAILVLVLAAAGCHPKPAPAPPDDPVWLGRIALQQAPFLVCTRAHESDTAGGYAAISPDWKYFGAYQFLRSTWDSWANSIGWHWLVGVRPDQAEWWEQDYMAWTLYQSAGNGPWGGRC